MPEPARVRGKRPSRSRSVIVLHHAHARVTAFVRYFVTSYVGRHRCLARRIDLCKGDLRPGAVQDEACTMDTVCWLSDRSVGPTRRVLPHCTHAKPGVWMPVTSWRPCGSVGPGRRDQEQQPRPAAGYGVRLDHAQSSQDGHLTGQVIVVLSRWLILSHSLQRRRIGEGYRGRWMSCCAGRPMMPLQS